MFHAILVRGDGVVGRDIGESEGTDGSYAPGTAHATHPASGAFQLWGRVPRETLVSGRGVVWRSGPVPCFNGTFAPSVPVSLESDGEKATYVSRAGCVKTGFQ